MRMATLFWCIVLACSAAQAQTDTPPAPTCDEAPVVAPAEPTDRAWYEPCPSSAAAVIAAAPRIIEEVAKACLADWKWDEAGRRSAQQQIMSVCPAYGPYQPACVAAVLMGTIGRDALQCFGKGVVAGAPMDATNREVLKAALESLLEVKDKVDLVAGARDLRVLSDEDRARFLNGLWKDWQKEVIENPLVSGVPRLAEHFATDEMVARALGQTGTETKACRLGVAEATLARAVSLASGAIDYGRRVVRDNERALRCIERDWAKVHGPGWRSANLSGPAADSYRNLEARAERFRAEESSWIRRIEETGTACTALRRMHASATSAAAEVAALRLQGNAAIARCDASRADEAITRLRRLEDSVCGRYLLSPNSTPWSHILDADRTARCQENKVWGGGWRSVGTGDCTGRDRDRSDGPRPDPAKCLPGSDVVTAVCWSTWCTYKTEPVTTCKGGANPGHMYSCE